MAEIQMIEHTDYRLALILPQSRQLLGIQGAGAIELPTISISPWERPAEQLTGRIEDKWKIQTIILDILVGPGSETPCAVAEVRTDSWDFEREGFCVAELDNIGDLWLEDEQRESLSAILSGNEVDRGAFAQVGWIEKAQEWIRSSIDSHEVIFTGEILQLNGGGAFCLLRLGTRSGPAYWIKGVGAPNAHEFAITGYLAQHYPEYLPPVIAMRSDWRAWVMEEFGSSLHSSPTLDDFKRAVHQLANLQKRVAKSPDELLAAQCADHRTGLLDSQIDDIFEYLDEAMGQQASRKALPLSTSRLHEIRTVLHDACFVLRELRIPDSLIHGDISPGSILCNGSNCVLTDWCEAYVGNPFIAFEQLCVHVRRSTGDSSLWIRALTQVYRSCWADLLTERQIEKTLQIVPLISVLSYLYGRGDWLHTSRRNEPAVQSYSRGLARHMDRIATDPALIEAICQPS
jgi:hypothetical protein